MMNYLNDEGICTTTYTYYLIQISTIVFSFLVFKSCVYMCLCGGLCALVGTGDNRVRKRASDGLELSSRWL